MYPIDTPDIYVLAEALETDIRRPPTHKGEELLLELSSSVVIDTRARPDGTIPIVQPIRAKLVARWLLDESGSRSIGWVYVGPVDLSRYADERRDSESLDLWLRRMLWKSCIRVLIVEREGDSAMIEAELRALERARGVN
ncbi:hypothetical protein WME89_48870 [Sorangium sp. So ce321]|uniref:hypothetical protein n=1 Tax=Sorangium sp. So ce321 TaxID=3133300 RepID=UPI003F62977A